MNAANTSALKLSLEEAANLQEASRREAMWREADPVRACFVCGDTRESPRDAGEPCPNCEGRVDGYWEHPAEIKPGGFDATELDDEAMTREIERLAADPEAWAQFWPKVKK